MTALEQVLTTKHVQYIRIAGDVPSSVRGVCTPFVAIFPCTYHEGEKSTLFSNWKIETLTNNNKTEKSRPSQFRTNYNFHYSLKGSRGVVEKCDLMVMISACINPWISHCVCSSDWFPRIFVPLCLSLPLSLLFLPLLLPLYLVSCLICCSSSSLFFFSTRTWFIVFKQRNRSVWPCCLSKQHPL